MYNQLLVRDYRKEFNRDYAIVVEFWLVYGGFPLDDLSGVIWY